jgi:hypothetical protein
MAPSFHTRTNLAILRQGEPLSCNPQAAPTRLFVGALRQQLGHDAARRLNAGVGQDHRVLLPRAFRDRASYELAVALGEMGVARAASGHAPPRRR